MRYRSDTVFALLCGIAVSAFSPVIAGAAELPKISEFTLPYGDAPAQIGLIARPEEERIGPLTFAIAPDGNLLVADTAHRELKEFSQSGNYVRTLIANTRPTCISFDGGGNVLLLLADRRVELHRRATGELLRVIQLPESVPLVEGYAQEVFAEGNQIGVNDPDENVFLFNSATCGDKPTTAASVQRGRATSKSERVFTASAASSGAQFVIAPEAAPVNGRAAATRPMRTVNAAAPAGRSLGAMLYRGDRAGAPIFEMEQIDDAAHKVHLILQKSSGSTLSISDSAAAEFPNDYFTTVYRKFEIMSDGTVWQMQTTPTGATLRHWSRLP